MATTKIWPVEDNLKRVIDYTRNPLKTENVDFNEYKYQGLENVLNYTEQDMKTEKQFYVSALNCDVETARSEMISTKKLYQKEDGILAFHGYQSFKPGEATPELAHQIGIELAREMWGDRFEVVVSTHLDKHHLHNHFVINSVSFADGKRYYDNKENYRKIRKLSDDLCRKYQLSVIEHPKRKGMEYGLWQAEQQHKPTRRSAIKEDVDYAISKSMTMAQFYSQLKEMGYELKFGKHIAVKAPYMERFVRLRSLSNEGDYTEDKIKEKILENAYIRNRMYHSSEKPKRVYYHGNLNKAKKLTGFRAMYFSYMYRMGVIPNHKPDHRRLHAIFKEDISHMDQVSKEARLISKKKINTIEDVWELKEEANKKLEDLIKERRCVYNKIRRCRNPDSKEALKKDVATLSAEIKELRKEVVLYESIEERSKKIKLKFEKIRELEKEEVVVDKKRSV